MDKRRKHRHDWGRDSFFFVWFMCSSCVLWPSNFISVFCLIEWLFDCLSVFPREHCLPDSLVGSNSRPGAKVTPFEPCHVAVVGKIDTNREETRRGQRAEQLLSDRTSRFNKHPLWVYQLEEDMQTNKRSQFLFSSGGYLQLRCT